MEYIGGKNNAASASRNRMKIIGVLNTDDIILFKSQIINYVNIILLEISIE